MVCVLVCVCLEGCVRAFCVFFAIFERGKGGWVDVYACVGGIVLCMKSCAGVNVGHWCNIF